MIQNELQTVSVVSFTSGIDAYGQPRQTESTRRTISMYLKVYSQGNVVDPRYVDVTMVGLTKDNNITSANQIVANGITYNVLYNIPSRRYNTILMKEAG